MTYHIGYVRDEKTLKVSSHQSFAERRHGTMEEFSHVYLHKTAKSRSLSVHEHASTSSLAMQGPHFTILDALQARQYLNKLPERFAPDDRILICDPMIATGRPLPAFPCLLIDFRVCELYWSSC